MARKCQWPISRDYLDSFIVFSKDNVEHTSCSSLKHFGCYGETKEMWGTKGFICIKLQVTVAEVTTVCPGGESRQEFETAARSRNHGGASLADFLVHSGFHSAGFLRELRTPCSQGPMLLTVGWVPLHHLTSKTIPNRHAHRPT